MDRSGRPRRVQSGNYHLTEFVELVRSDIAHGPKIETGLGPIPNIVTLDRLEFSAGLRRAQSPGDEQIDNVLAALIDNRRYRLAVDIIEAAAEEPETLSCQVDDRRCDVEPAINHGLTVC